jgi:hypothetical protein
MTSGQGAATRLAPAKLPSEVMYQDRALGSVLSVDCSFASGEVVPFTASSRALASATRQPATLIPSIAAPAFSVLAC